MRSGKNVWAKGENADMDKLDRLFFDIGCIIMIIILPYFVLEKIGIVDYVEKSKQKGVV